MALCRKLVLIGRLSVVGLEKAWWLLFKKNIPLIPLHYNPTFRRVSLELPLLLLCVHICTSLPPLPVQCFKALNYRSLAYRKLFHFKDRVVVLVDDLIQAVALRVWLWCGYVHAARHALTSIAVRSQEVRHF